MNRAAWAKRRFADDLLFAENMLLKRRALQPMFVLHAADTMYFVTAGFVDDREKRATYEAVKTMCVAHNIDAISVLCEAWMRSVTKRDDETDSEWEARAEAKRPSAAPDRVEIVAVTLTYRDAGERRTLHSMRAIIRDNAGDPTRLGEDFGDPEAATSGEVAELLPIYPPPPEQRERALLSLRRLGVSATEMRR